MEGPWILHPLRWPGNLFVGNLLFQKASEAREKMETGPACWNMELPDPASPWRAGTVALVSADGSATLPRKRDVSI